MAVNRMSQYLDSEIRGWCYRSEEFAAILVLGFVSACGRSLFPICEEMGTLDFSILALGEMNETPSNKDTVPSQQKISIGGKPYHFLESFRCEDHRESSRACWAGRAEHGAERG